MRNFIDAIINLVVIIGLWLAGVALVGLCALALYLVWQALAAGA